MSRTTREKFQDKAVIRQTKHKRREIVIFFFSGFLPEEKKKVLVLVLVLKVVQSVTVLNEWEERGKRERLRLVLS